MLSETMNMSEEITRRLDAMEEMLPELELMLVDLQQSDLNVVTKSNSFDLVTRADTASETKLIEFITKRFAEDLILSEEGSHAASAEDAGGHFLWILDPIDGTTNFANGLPVWGISIGLMLRSEVVGGLVSAPGLGLRYRAVKGGGAYRNRERISVNDRPTIGEGIIATGFPYDRAKRAKPICLALENMLLKAGGIRRLGAASLDLCFVADGRFAGYYEMGLKPWDYAAGSLVAAEAGAIVTDLRGDSLDIFSSLGTVTTNGFIHAELIREVEPLIAATAM